MEILGIGPSELLFILIIALILLGPKDMAKTGRMIGRWMRKIVMSDGWKIFQQTSREIQTLPTRLMREAQLDELKDLGRDIKGDLKQTSDSIQETTRLPRSVLSEPGNTIRPDPSPLDAAEHPSDDKGKHT